MNYVSQKTKSETNEKKPVFNICSVQILPDKVLNVFFNEQEVFQNAQFILKRQTK